MLKLFLTYVIEMFQIIYFAFLYILALTVPAANGKEAFNNGVNLGSLEEIKPLRSKYGKSLLEMCFYTLKETAWSH